MDFFLDENQMDRRLRQRLGVLGVGALAATEAGRLGLTDEAQLEWASERGMAIVTNNIRDFAVIATQWALAGRTHAGIICVTEQRANPEVVARKLAEIARRSPSALRNALVYLNDDPAQTF